MVTLFYWGLDQWGHAAIQAGDQYLSFHPADRRKSTEELVLDVPSIYHENFQDPGGYRTFSSIHLNERSVADKIRELRRSQPGYSLLRNNCSHMAKRALVAGLDDVDRQVLNRIIDDFRSIGGSHVDHCGAIDEVADILIEKSAAWGALGARVRGPGRAVALLAAGLLGGKRVGVLSPADVLRFMQRYQ